MGYIELSSQKTTEPAPLSNRQDIADADIDRVAYWGAKTFFPNGVTDGDGTREPTGAEVFAAITDAVYAQIKRDVEALYLREAEAAARASVPPIVLTPTE